MKKVTVIIPCYNQGQYVQEAVESVINQTYKNIEIICINDCSSDSTTEILENLVSKHNDMIVLNNQENKGVCFSRNRCVEVSTGEYILPLDADDTIEPTFIEKAVKILDENQNIGIVYSKVRLFGQKHGVLNLPDFNRSSMLYENCIVNTAMFRKSEFRKVGGYNLNMVSGFEDYDLWLSLLELGLDVHLIDEVLFNYRKHKDASRTDVCSENFNNTFSQLIRNHINLYVQDKQFVERLWGGNVYKLKSKYKKYKKLFTTFMLVSIFEALFVFILIILLIISFKK